MHTKIIVRKEDVIKFGVEEALLLLAKIIHSEPDTWAFIPADNLPTLIRTLDSHRIPYGVESNHAFIRQRTR
jgi:hypothetical protein